MTAVARLEAIGLTKRFGATLALSDVGFEVRPGEVHALVGENGAGKSTLVKIFGGAQAPDSGELRIDGHRIELPNPSASRAHGIAVIHQELIGVPGLEVARNVLLGQEPRHRLGGIDWKAGYRQAETALRRVGMEAHLRELFEALPPTERQLVRMAQALSSDARVLILDEPTAALGAKDAARLFDRIRALAAEGVSIVYISHRLDEVLDLADRVTVLRDGRRIDTLEARGLKVDELVQLMIGRQLERMSQAAGRQHAAGAGKEALRIEGLAGPPFHEPVSLSIDEGEIVGLTGQLGSGAVELNEIVAGVRDRSGGQIEVGGRPLSIRNPADAIGAGIALVPEERGTQALVVGRSIASNLVLPQLKRLSRLGILGRGRANALARDYVARLGVKAASIDAPMTSLSGGNQQKVVIGRWLAVGPRVLLLNEPTRGIDVGAKADIYELLFGLAAEGVTIVVASTDVPELTLLCRRVLVMQGGRVTAELRDERVTEHEIQSAMSHSVDEAQEAA